MYTNAGVGGITTPREEHDYSDHRNLIEQSHWLLFRAGKAEGLFSSFFQKERQPRKELIWPRPSAGRVKSSTELLSPGPVRFPPARASTFHADCLQFIT